jgi:hypothetical protein
VPSVRIVHDKRATLAQEHPGHKGALYAPPPVHKSEVEPLILVETMQGPHGIARLVAGRIELENVVCVVCFTRNLGVLRVVFDANNYRIISALLPQYSG